MRKKDIKKTSENITISYKGNVTVEAINAKTGKKTRRVQKHNEGFSNFFELIALSIAGNDMSASMPRYLRGLDENNNFTVASFIAYNNPIIIKEAESATVKFEFLIPFTQLSATETTKLRLYNRTTSTETPFAEVELGEEDAFSGDGQTNYLVVWTITIGNAPA